MIHAACALALTPGLAAAVPVILTFDTGEYDDTIPDPGGDEHGPYDWLEAGVRITGLWAADVGTAGAYWKQGHTHLQLDGIGGGIGFAEAYHAWTNDLLGLYITLENGGTFDVISLDYRLKRR